MKVKILKNLRIVRDCCYDAFMDEKSSIDDIMARANTPEESVNILKGIVSTLLCSDNISEETRIFIVNSGFSVKEVNEHLNLFKDKPVNYATSVTRISTDEKKLAIIFGEDFVKNMIYSYDVKNLNKIMDRFYAEFGAGTGNLSKINLKLNLDNQCMVVSHNDFVNGLRQLEPYLFYKKFMLEKVINNNNDVMGYINYLLSAKGAKDLNARKDRMTLMKFLNNIYYEPDMRLDDESEDYLDNTETTSESNIISELDLMDSNEGIGVSINELIDE